MTNVDIATIFCAFFLFYICFALTDVICCLHWIINDAKYWNEKMK